MYTYILLTHGITYVSIRLVIYVMYNCKFLYTIYYIQ